MTNRPVVVLGSANVDVTIQVDRIPEPGETVLTAGSGRGPGGKGANQVIAAARAGAETVFLAAVGTDDGGRMLLSTLSDANVDIAAVRRIEGDSGGAYVMIEKSGENAIVVVGGANGQLLDLTDAEREIIRGGAVLLMQLESPMQTVIDAARTAHDAGVYVVLNAAPYADLPEDLLAAVDLLNVNEHEAALALGHDSEPELAAVSLGERVPDVLITLGSRGALYRDRSGQIVHIAAPSVSAVDTTGAGDTYAGAFCAALAAGAAVADRMRFAGTAAALAVQRPGAAASIPERAEIDTVLTGFYPR